MKKLISSKIINKAIWKSTPNTQFEELDFDNSSRSILLNKCSINNPKVGTSGFFNSEKCNKKIYYESQLELRFFAMLEHSKEIETYGHQPIEIKYKNKHKNLSSYFPDFYYQLITGACVIGEIKKISEMGLYSNWLKWRGMKSFCIKHGLGLLITDGFTTITDLKHRKVNTEFKKELLEMFKEFNSIDWQIIYDLKKRHDVSIKELTYLVIQEKIKWHKKPSYFLKDGIA